MKKYYLIILISFLPLSLSALNVEVLVNTGQETVNALEGTLVLPQGITLESIHIGNSAILMWITGPTMDKERNVISFAGITPGGFSGTYPLFTIKGLSADDLNGSNFIGVNAYGNDESGTRVNVAFEFREVGAAEDTASPETFRPIVASSPDAYDGKHFVSFVTQDKGTGVDYYQYGTTWFFRPSDDEWLRVESPVTLSTKDKFMKVYVRAVDKAGNTRTVSTAGPYYNYLLLFGVIMLVCILLYARRSLRSRYSPS